MYFSIHLFFHSCFMQSLPQELNKTYDIIKLTTQSLMKCHKMAINAAGREGLSAHTIVDGKYSHNEVGTIHSNWIFTGNRLRKTTLFSYGSL